MPNFRIKKHTKGWVVEVQKRKWYGVKYWTHFISVAGIESQPWYHPTFDLAMMSLLDEIKFMVNRNVRIYNN